MSTPDTGRIAQIDVLRGFAVLGVFWIGVGAFGMPFGANALPTLLGTPSTLNLAIWASTEVFMEGAMRGLFSMLFGASALIYLDQARLERDGVALVDRFYRRNLILMLFGLIHAYLLLWPHDVLYAYGLIGLFLFPLRRAPAWALLLAGVLLHALSDLEIDWSGLLAGPEGQAMGSASPEESGRFLAWLKLQMEEDLALYRSGYLQIFVAQVQEVMAQQSTLFYRRHFFEIGGMMLIGMAFYRWGLLSGRASWGLYLTLALVGLGLGGWLRGIDLYRVYVLGFDPLTLVRLEEGSLDLGRLPVTLGHVGLIGLLCHWGRAPWLTRPLAATGRLALTHYISQTLIAILIFYGFGLGLFGRLERWQLLILWLVVALAQMGLSVLWLRHFRYGPLEWIWRSLIYGRAQPMRLHA
ncbi:MAG: DUF418 domain-containing protein [Bdellovibrio bacteriovorus]